MNINFNKGNRILPRRDFLGKVGTAAAAFAIVPRHVLAGKRYLQPSDTINVAGIGIGSRGIRDLIDICDPDADIITPHRSPSGQPLSEEEFAKLPEWMQQNPQPMGQRPIKLANIYALCDVDTEFAAYAIKAYSNAKFYMDWRELLEKEKAIDAVVIGTPDHNHAPIAAAFIKANKHVYVEKPMAKTIYECRRLAELAKEYDVVTQMGNQGHATEGTKQTVEWIQSGVIGPVSEVHLYTGAPSWPQGNIMRPAGVRIPKTLNWDIWLGPAPFKPYHPDICHFNWRGLRDYGTGAMGDMGAHIFDAVIWALNLDYPVRIQATSTPYNQEYFPQGELITYEFAERFTPGIGYMPPVKVIWHDGGLKPPRPKELEPDRILGAAVYYGENGIIMHDSHGAMPELVPEAKDFKVPDPWLTRTGNIFEDWIDAIKRNGKSSNDFSYASKVAEIMLLANISVLMQQSNHILEYDAANMSFSNLSEANNHLHYPYRDGWTL